MGRGTARHWGSGASLWDGWAALGYVRRDWVVWGTSGRAVGAVAHGCVGKGAPHIGAAGMCRSGVQDASGNVGLAWGHARRVYGHVLRRWGCSGGLLGVVDALGTLLWVCTRCCGSARVRVAWVQLGLVGVHTGVVVNGGGAGAPIGCPR